MFFASWGAHSEVKDLGPCGVYHCTKCDKDGEFHALLTYRVRHAYWLFRWVTGKQRHTACGNCGSVYQAEQASFGEQAERDAIPFMDRRGWTIGAGIIGSLGVAGAMAAAADTRQNAASISAPHVGDIYEVNTAHLMEKPDRPNMFSAMRVLEVHGGDVSVQVGKSYFESLNGVQRDVREGRTSEPAYYMNDAIVIKSADLKRFYDDGTIADVD